MHNTQIWGYINIYCNPTIYLFSGQYILKNVIYTSIKYMVPTYKVLKANYSENHTFNKELSHIWINIKLYFKYLREDEKA